MGLEPSDSKHIVLAADFLQVHLVATAGWQVDRRAHDLESIERQPMSSDRRARDFFIFNSIAKVAATESRAWA